MLAPNDPQWAGVEPIKCPQNQEYPFYVSHGGTYGRGMELFRSILNTNEYSERALELTTILMGCSYSDADVYYYREKILEHLGFNFDQELALNTALLYDCLKPYQLWSHRKWIYDHLPEGQTHDETIFITNMLEKDRRNFHAWTFSSWYADKFNKHDWLFAITTSQITDDPFNNGAWSMRYNLLSKMNMKPGDDLEFSLNQLQQFPLSQSCASYIKGILDLDFSLAAIVKSSLDEIISKNPEFVAPLILASQIANKEGDMALYDKYIDQLENADSMRSHFWSLMKSSSKRFS